MSQPALEERFLPNEPPLDAKLELLWRLYDDHQQMARHHDGQRSTLTQYILILAAAAVGVAKIGEFSPVVNSVLAVFVIGAGLIGICLMQSHSRDCRNQDTCANKYRIELERLVPEIRLDEEEPAPAYTGSGPWNMFHILVVLLGVALLLCVHLHGQAAGALGAP